MLTAFPVGAGKSQSHATHFRSIGLWRNAWPAKNFEATLSSLRWVAEPGKATVSTREAVRRLTLAHFPLAPLQTPL